MDNKKVEQVLKKIFDKYGTEIVQNRKKFIGAVFDLLDEWNYKNERIVLKHVAESNAFSTLLAISPITGDAAERAVRQIQDEIRMTKEDAEFIVRCVIAARGQDPDIVTENETKRQQEEAERLRKAEEEQKRMEEEQKRQEKARKQQEDQKRQEEEQKQREEEKRQEEERKQREEEKRQEEERKQRKEEKDKQIKAKKKRRLGIFGMIGAAAVILIVVSALSNSDKDNNIPLSINNSFELEKDSAGLDNNSLLAAEDEKNTIAEANNLDFILANAEESPTTDFEYTVYDDYIQIDKYIGDSADVVIPSRIEDKPVKRIGEWAFSEKKNIVNVRVPDEVLEIGSYAFISCSNLSNIYISGNVTKIEGAVFGYCVSIMDIYLPDTVEEIGVGAFRDCISLKSIKIPENITKIESYAFEGCRSLGKISFPDSTEIAEDAFSEWDRTQFKSGITEDAAYQYNVYDDYVEIIRYRGSESLADIPAEIEGKSVTKIYDYAFQDCLKLTDVTMPSSITKIESCVFSGCENLENISISENVTEIGEMAFAYCKKLTKIEIPYGVTIIEYGTFRDCEKLTDIILPDSITEIRNYVFGNCKSLKSITIPKNVSQIADSIFCRCDKLTDIWVPEQLDIPDGILDECPNAVIVEYKCNSPKLSIVQCY